MTTAEAATTTVGPRYAPDDPTLPKPWKGLIDGTTGLLYYWNPETNVTQYEKPAIVPPPLPLGQSTASTPKLAPIPGAHSVQPNGLVVQHGQQMSQSPQQQPQPVSQHGHVMSQQQSPLGTQVAHHQQGSQMVQAGQQQRSQLSQTTPQQVQVTQLQMMQHLGPQMPQHLMQQLPQQSSQQSLQQPVKQLSQQTISQYPQQLGQPVPQNQGSQMPQAQAQQFAQQQLQYMAYLQNMAYPQNMAYQQNMHPHGQQTPQPQTQHNVQGQSYANQQEYRQVFPKREEEDFQSRNQIRFSPSQYSQAGVSAVQNIPAAANLAQMPQIGFHSGQTQHFGGPLQNMQTSSMGQLHTGATDLVNHSHGSRFLNERDPSVMPSQHSDMPSVGLRRGPENNLHGRGGNDKEGITMGPQQPMLDAIPMSRNQQVMNDNIGEEENIREEDTIGGVLDALKMILLVEEKVNDEITG